MDVLVKYARDERVIRDAFSQRAFLQVFEIFAGYPDVYATIFPERRSRIALISLQRAIFVADALLLAGIKRFDDLFLLFIELGHHRPPRYRFVALRLGMMVFKNNSSSDSTNGTR